MTEDARKLADACRETFDSESVPLKNITLPRASYEIAKIVRRKA